MSETKTANQTIESGTEFDGVVRSLCPIVVSGQLKGEIFAPMLTVTTEGSVNGKVKVSRLKAEGSLAGDIEADSVELSGSVSDGTVIRANAIEVKLNQAAGRQLQVRFGNCELCVGDPANRSNPETQEDGHQNELPTPELVGVN
jgi:cytoskeletal protein CcmA (bactofilin family)